MEKKKIEFKDKYVLYFCHHFDIWDSPPKKNQKGSTRNFYNRMDKSCYIMHWYNIYLALPQGRPGRLTFIHFRISAEDKNVTFDFIFETQQGSLTSSYCLLPVVENNVLLKIRI